MKGHWKDRRFPQDLNANCPVTPMPSRRTKSRKSEFKNQVKEKLKRGESVIGPVISVNNVEVAAQCAALGFDFVWLEMEHAPLMAD